MNPRGSFAVVAVLVGLLLAACAEPPPGDASSEQEPSLPTTIEIVCEADGTTTLLTPEVEVRSDGVGLRVRSKLDEPASVNGLGMDVEPGVTEHLTAIGPGAVHVACWPFSRHPTGVEPPTQRVTVRDPDRLYVSSELSCPSGEMSWSSIYDFIDTSTGRYADPIEAARDWIEDRPGDEFHLAGYPDQSNGRPVIVIREGSTVASVAVGRADDGRWYVGGGSGCEGVGTAF